jgi:peptide/nickel transport system ATP-binding protein
MSEILLVDDLSVRLPRRADRTHALKNISFSLSPNEIVCIVGESGAGKSMTANAIMRLLPRGVQVESGRILFEGEDLCRLPERALRRVRGVKIGMIFQEPMTALNPLRTVGDQIAEMFRVHTSLKLSKARIADHVESLLAEVRLSDPAAAARAYPHELSGGQRQRAMIAMALALEPYVLIADEPTTALDVTTQAQILTLIRDLQRRTGMAVLFVTHDFGIVAEIAGRVVVMQNGMVVEQGAAGQVLNEPRHPYTRALIAAVPTLTPKARVPRDRPAILTIESVAKTYRTRGLFGRHRVTRAVRDVTLALAQGSTLGIVGESGSGKTTLARCLVGLIETDAGIIHLAGRLLRRPRDEIPWRTRTIQMVFQDPFGSLNPRKRVGELVAQGPIAHGADRGLALARARELFALVGLDPAATERYPHEFSGGQRQRIALARALSLQPKVLVADEPVSALDVSVQAQVLRLLDDLRERFGLSMIFITHDLRVAAQVCDHIAVMRNGVVVEQGAAADVFGNPQHPYTRALLASVPGREWQHPAGRGAR